MHYTPYFSPHNPYLMYHPQQHPQSSSTTMGTQNPMERVIREQVPPPPFVSPIVTAQEATISGQAKAKMTYYLKLDAPKYKEGDDPFKYVKAVKTIVNELDASDSRAIEMVIFTKM
ncbi:hypothetical protein P3X46_013858 [Hevea brasiliensis]|uniref:Uncharacterized protein n=1 Tax=Hevea brasiliensis TaxID=3981 RepID=A0ABQ9M6L3_HEVBR|nr:hypothetical protein P3X46_013858 [Hevea brasiliensis]